MQIKTSNPTKPLTPRQLQLLTMVAAFQNSRCYSPTMAEIAAELRISRSTAFEHIAELRRKKLLSASSGRARSLTITSKAQELLNRRTTCPPAPLSQQPAAGIPLLGRVALINRLSFCRPRHLRPPGRRRQYGWCRHLRRRLRNLQKDAYSR
ncbi:MAG: LexA family protein [Planctomycetota bacterium]